MFTTTKLWIRMWKLYTIEMGGKRIRNWKPIFNFPTEKLKEFFFYSLCPFVFWNISDPTVKLYILVFLLNNEFISKAYPYRSRSLVCPFYECRIEWFYRNGNKQNYFVWNLTCGHCYKMWWTEFGQSFRCFFFCIFYFIFHFGLNFNGMEIMRFFCHLRFDAFKMLFRIINLKVSYKQTAWHHNAMNVFIFVNLVKAQLIRNLY